MTGTLDMGPGKRGERGNEIDARVIKYPEEPGKVVRLDIVQHEGIVIGRPDAVMAVQNTIGKMFSEHGRLALKKISGPIISFRFPPATLFDRLPMDTEQVIFNL